MTKADLKYLFLALVLFLMICARGFGQAAHSASWSVNYASCTTSTAPCTASLWSAIIPSGNCPAIGNSAYINIAPALVPLPANVTPTNTHWDYMDTRSVLTSGSIYCGYVNAQFTTGGGPGGASVVFQGQIPSPPVTPPAGSPGMSIILK